MKQVRRPGFRVRTLFDVYPLVKRYADEVVAPKVREMDENEMMDKDIIKGLFEQGVGVASLIPRLTADWVSVPHSSWVLRHQQTSVAQSLLSRPPSLLLKSSRRLILPSP